MMAGIFDFFPGSNPTRSVGLRSAAMTGLGADPGEAIALSLLRAMDHRGRGGQRDLPAGPMGEVAQNLIPIFGAIIQGQAIQKQAEMEKMLLQAKIAQLGGDPEMKAAKIKQLEALTAQETSLAEERKSKASYRDKQQQLVEKLMGGSAGAEVPGGMKPTITMGPSGPSVTYKSDVMSPEALQQRKEIQAAGASTTLNREKSFETWKQQHPKLTQRQLDALDAGNSLLSILDEIPQAVAGIPKDMSRAQIATQASKYQARAEHPVLTNALTGITGGVISADTDPRLDPYFSTVGQAQQALTTFGLVGLRGGYRTLQWLQVHFPGWADDPATVMRKAAFLQSNKGIVRKKVEELQNSIKNAASIAQEIGGEPTGDTVRVKVRNKKTGQEQYIEYDPATGSTSVPEPSVVPQGEGG